jgi:hypothetical protein
MRASDFRSRSMVVALGAVTILWQGIAALQHDHGMGAMPGGEPAHQMGADICAEPTLNCAVSATPFFAADGKLWLAWAGSGTLSVARSADLGRTFTPPVRVTPTRVRLDDGPDEKPQIVVDEKGHIVVGYAIFKDDKFNGQVFVASSSNGGVTFSPPRPITPDGSSQRFISLALDPNGSVFASWIDKRNVVAAQQAHKAFAGASLAFAWSKDGGTTFLATHIAHDNLCECCRLGTGLAGSQRPVVLFRNVFDGERDHAVITFIDPSTPGPVYRVSADHWKIDTCPDHGPSLSIAPDGGYHVTWFSGGGVRQGAFYAHSGDGGRTFSAPMPIGSSARHPTRPYVIAVGKSVWLAWKEFDGQQTTVNAMVSHDRGTTWSAPKSIAATTDFSDHPILVSDATHAYLSWLTHNEGYRLVSLEGAL